MRSRFDSQGLRGYRARMPRDGSLTVSDLVGKELEYLELECTKCPRRGRYRVSRLLEELGPDGMLTYWSEGITADCPRRIAGNHADWCGCRAPALVELFAR